MTNFKAVLLVALLGLLPSTAFCYKPELHTYLTEAAAKNSNLSQPYFWSDWGYTGIPKLIPTFVSSPTYDTKGRAFNTSWDYFYVMGYGADIEDTGLDVAFSRAFNHFYNPQPPGGEKLPAYFTMTQPNFTSADWALGIVETSGVTVPDYPNSVQRWSYLNAGEHFYNSLVAPSASTRAAELSKTIQSLGHVVHHVQDMAQPQHTRIDAHCDAPACLVANPDDVSVYEIWTEELLKQGVINQATISGYPTVAFSQPRDFWHNNLLQGLADFSSRNFITTDTSFSYAACNLANNCQFSLEALGSHSSSLPQPDGDTSVTGAIEVPISDFVNVPAGLANGKMLFISQKMTDRYTNQVLNVNRMATFSVFSERLSKVSRTAGFQFKNVFTVNKFNLEEQYKILLPRAVGYSTGLINHFFKHRIDITPISQGAYQNPKWQITNVSFYPLVADLQLYYDTTDNVRLKLPGGYIGLKTLPPGGSIIINSFNPPQNTSDRYMLVASTIQNDVDIGIAGKAFIADLITPVPCGEPVSASGGIEGYDQLHSLGTQAGTFTIDFEAYNLKDRLKVTRGDGQTVASTDSMFISGHRTYTLNYNPDTWGGTNIRVLIDSQEPQTQWDLDITCPGNTGPAKTVTFTLGDPDATKECGYKLYIAGELLLNASRKKYHGEVTTSLHPGTYQFVLQDLYCKSNNILYGGTYPMWYRIGSGPNIRIVEGDYFTVQ